MQVAIWIIAIAEVIRLIQNSIQLVHMKIARKAEIELRKNLNNDFVKSLDKPNEEFVKKLLEEFLKQESEDKWRNSKI